MALSLPAAEDRELSADLTLPLSGQYRYLQVTIYDANDQPGVAELIIAKNRAGATGTVKMGFLKNLTRFENLAQIAEPGGGAF